METSIEVNADTAILSTPRFEARMLCIIAGPLIAAYLAEAAILLTTKSIVGKLGYKELASVGLAGDFGLEIAFVFIGVLSVVGVLVAQADGAGNKADAGNAARQGFIVSLLLGIPMTLLVANLDLILALTGQDPEVIALMGSYLVPFSLGMIPLLWFFILRTFVASLAKTGAVMVISIIAIGLNYILCKTLVEGLFGFPALGIAGAGWSMSLVSVFMFLALLAYTYMTPTFRGYGLFRGRLVFDPKTCKQIFYLGLPVAGIVILEAGLFAATSILSGVLGAIPLATYQVIIAWVGIAFMTAHGIAEAGMIRVAHGIGRGSMPAARQAGLLTFAMGIGLLLILTAIPLNFPEPLVKIFLEPNDPGFPAVLELTTRLLILAAFFQIFDGLQVMASLALRGLKDTLVPLYLATIGYWVFGVAGGWYLAFPLGLGVDGLWWGMAVGLTVTGSLLALRFLILTSAKPN